MDHTPASPFDYTGLHERTREQGANLIVYAIVRLLFQPFFHIYFRMGRMGRHHIPASGPVIVASNHRSFLDPFVIATMARRPMYYMAKKEMFANRWRAWLLCAVGAFPVDRGAGDNDSIDTCKAILARGEIVLIFPEGTRTRPGGLGTPRRGVGRLALETGAPVVPVAVIGTEAVRRGWRIRPHKVRIRAGRPLTFPHVSEASPALAATVTDRIWPRVMLQWEWLGGQTPARRVAIIGGGSWGTSLAASLHRAGLDVDLGAIPGEQPPARDAARSGEPDLGGAAVPDGVRVMAADELRLDDYDIVCLAVAARTLPAVLRAHGGRISSRVGVLVVSRGLVGPLGTLPSAFVAERCRARAIAVLGGPIEPGELARGDAAVVVASIDRGFARQLADAIGGDRLTVSITSDVTGVELAGCAADVAVLAAAAAATQGDADAADAVAGRVFAEVDALARARGGRPETFAGLAAGGDLVAGAVAAQSGEHRAGELLARGVPVAEIGRVLGGGADALESVALLAAAARAARVDAPALDGLAAVLDGRIGPEQWAATVAQGPVHDRSRSIRVA